MVIWSLWLLWALWWLHCGCGGRRGSGRQQHRGRRSLLHNPYLQRLCLVSGRQVSGHPEHVFIFYLVRSAYFLIKLSFLCLPEEFGKLTLSGIFHFTGHSAVSCRSLLGLVQPSWWVRCKPPRPVSSVALAIKLVRQTFISQT